MQLPDASPVISMTSLMRAMRWLACMLLVGLGCAAQAAEPEVWLGLPVTDGGRSYTFAPWPALEMRDLKLATTEPILINRAWVSPDWATWITEFKTTRMRVKAAQVIATPAALARLGIIDGRSTHKISALKFDSLRLKLGSNSLDLPAGEMEFSADGTLARIRVTLAQGVTLEASPHAGKLALMLQTASWKWSALPGFLFESLVAQGEMSNDGIVMTNIAGNAEGGVVRGNLQLAVTDVFKLDGQLKLEAMRAKDLLGRLYPRHPLQGTLGADLKVATQASDFFALGKDLSVSGTYTIRDGSIDRFGLLEGLRKSGGGVAGGGLTKFDVMSGSINGKAGQSFVMNIQRLDAGALQGSGSATMDAEGKLRGRFAGSIRLPNGFSESRAFSLTGTFDSPTLIIAN